MVALSLNECSRETTLLEFVPDDAYLLYAMISKAWLSSWRSRKRPPITHSRHLYGSPRLIAIALGAGGSKLWLTVAAAGAGDLEALQKLTSEWSCGFATEHATAAATGGHLHVLKWLDWHRPGLWEATFYAAGKAGHLAIVSWNTSRRTSALCGAAAGGQLHILEWAADRDLFLPSHVACAAAEHGRLDVLNWMLDRVYLLSSSVCWTAAKYGKTEVLDWAIMNGMEIEWDICKTAAEHGRISVLEWAAANGYWDAECICGAAALGGHLGTLQWALANGCERNVWSCQYVAVHGNLEALQMLRANGFPWDSSVYWAARYVPHLVVWLRENGCPRHAV